MIKKISFYNALVFLVLSTLIIFLSYSYLESWSDESIEKNDNFSQAATSRMLAFNQERLIDQVEYFANDFALNFDYASEAELKRKLKGIIDSNDAIEAAMIVYEDGRALRSMGYVANFDAKSSRREYYTRVFENRESSFMTQAFTNVDGSFSIAAAAKIETEQGIPALLTFLVNTSSMIPDLDFSYAISTAKGDIYMSAGISKSWLGENIFEIRPIYHDVAQMAAPISINIPMIYGIQPHAINCPMVRFYGLCHAKMR